MGANTKDLGRYELTGLTETHLRVINRALDFMFRVGMGQFRELVGIADPTYKRRGKVQDEVERLLDRTRDLLMPELKPGAYWGIRAPEISDDYRVACDIHQVIRHRLAWDRNPKGDFTVDFDEPWRWSERVEMVGIRPENDQLPPPPAEITLPEMAREKPARKRAAPKPQTTTSKKAPARKAATKPATKARKA